MLTRLTVPSVRKEDHKNFLNKPKQALPHYSLKTELKLSHPDAGNYQCWIMVYAIGLPHPCEALGDLVFQKQTL